RSSLLMTGDGPTVESCMTDPVSVLNTESIESAEELSREHGGAPIPVVDDGDRLVGMFGLSPESPS
ncbi:MAG: hypothetical protein OEO77_06415, partial [Acidimicrobiia bacterium]|nr:hypothetical protein [Acidimicrobiia bacterium]